jgi:multimeric flavodoxin WrbA
MNITIIYGQQHHGNTYKLTQMLLTQLSDTETTIREFSVNGMPQCVGCCQCIMKDERLCPHRDRTDPIITAMENADIIIFASPNYCFEMTGQMKSFCDHLAYRWMIHRPYDMRRKIGVAISTTAGGGAFSVTKSIKRQMQWWSIGRVFRLNLAIWADSIEKMPEKRRHKLEKRVEKLAKKIKHIGSNPHPCIKVKLLFRIMKKLHSKEGWNEVETVYWSSMN